MQTELLSEIRKHTRLIYAVCIFWVVLTGLSLLLGFVLLIISAGLRTI